MNIIDYVLEHAEPVLIDAILDELFSDAEDRETELDKSFNQKGENRDVRECCY
jgi:hypothetical protein